MAGHNSLKYFTALGLLGRRIFGLNEDETGIERLGETLTPIANLWEPLQLEWAPYRGENIFARRVTIPAVAARNSILTLDDPSTSNLLAKVFLLQTSVACDVSAQLGSVIAAIANPVVNDGFPTDTRVNLSPSLGGVSALKLTTGDAAAGGTLTQLRTNVNGLFSYLANQTGWILAPGTNLSIVDPTVNEAVTVTIWWSERVLFPGEGSIGI